jgi:hypothetical protein
MISAVADITPERDISVETTVEGERRAAPGLTVRGGADIEVARVACCSRRAVRPINTRGSNRRRMKVQRQVGMG